MPEEKKYKTTRDMLRKGAVLQSYGKTHMLSVNPAPDIERVRFSVVKLGTGGKDALDVYLSLEDMRLLCREIDCGAAARRIAADNGDWPAAYQWQKGKDGCKKLAIGGGRAGVRVQAQEKKEGEWIRMMAVMQPNDIYTMSFHYRIVMGLAPVSGFYQSLVDEFWAGVEDRKKFHASFNPETDGDYAPQDEERGGAPGSTGTMAAVTASPIEDRHLGSAPCGIVAIRSKDGAAYRLVFTEDMIRSLGAAYQRLKNSAGAAPTQLSFTFQRGRGDMLFFTAFANAA